MSTYAVAYVVLFLVGLLFGSLPFIGGLRALPRWIRIALLMIGLSFFFGAAFGVALNAVASRLSPQMYSLLYAHKILVFGAGVGILLLLLFSGEYFKALRELDAERRRQLSATHTESSHEQV